MYHLFLDVRVTRRLTACFLTDSRGRALGQHRYVGDAFDQLFELTPGQIEVHTATQVLKIEVLTTAQVSEDAKTLGDGLALAPWQTEADI